MTFAKFIGAIGAVLLASVLLVWVLVSLAAFVFALTEGDGGAAGLYALFVVGGVGVGLLAWWLGTRVVKARAPRQ